MARHINRCGLCQSYTLKENCSCGGKAVTCAPPKYSPVDKYGSYRREVKKISLKKEGLI